MRKGFLVKAVKNNKKTLEINLIANSLEEAMKMVLKNGKEELKRSFEGVTITEEINNEVIVHEIL